VQSTANLVLAVREGKIVAPINSIVQLPPGLLKPRENQPRKLFHEETIKAMAESCLLRNDVEYPLMVMIHESGDYAEIIDGERRWRAAKQAELSTISCYIRPYTQGRDLLLISAKANFCREDMSPIETAYAINELMNEFNWTKSEVARQVGKTPQEVYQLLKYLELDKEIQSLLLYGKIDKGLAYQLATYDKSHQAHLLKILVTESNNRGKPLHPNEAARLLRRESEIKNYKPRQPKKGKKHATATEMTVNHVYRQINNLEKGLEELSSVPTAELKRVKGTHFLDMLQELKHLQKQVAKQILRLENID